MPRQRFAIGDQVCIERDQTRYSSKGTWPQFRGKTGTVIMVNRGEFGVAFRHDQLSRRRLAQKRQRRVVQGQRADRGADHFDTHAMDPGRKATRLAQQLQALGYRVTLEHAA